MNPVLGFDPMSDPVFATVVSLVSSAGAELSGHDAGGIDLDYAASVHHLEARHGSLKLDCCCVHVIESGNTFVTVTITDGARTLFTLQWILSLWSLVHGEIPAADAIEDRVVRFVSGKTVSEEVAFRYLTTWTRWFEDAARPDYPAELLPSVH